MVEIETRDGNIFLGYVIEENEDFYKLRTKDGMIIDIPNVSIINLIRIETRRMMERFTELIQIKVCIYLHPLLFLLRIKVILQRFLCIFSIL